MEIMGLGSRVVRELRGAGHALSWTGALSMTTVPGYASALASVTEWLRRYEDYAIDVVDTIYNTDRGAGTYEPTVTRLIPPSFRSALAPALWMICLGGTPSSGAMLSLRPMRRACTGGSSNSGPRTPTIVSCWMRHRRNTLHDTS